MGVTEEVNMEIIDEVEAVEVVVVVGETGIEVERLFLTLNLVKNASTPGRSTRTLLQVT